MALSFHYSTVPTPVRVTKADIRRGVTCNCLRCPAALAIRRELQALQVSVLRDRVQVEYGRVVHGYRCVGFMLPAEVKEHLRRYDETGWMMPFEFTVEVPRKEVARG